MKNKKYITPNEINKYMYCPYQWYYEKHYGRKKIKDLYDERNKKLNLEDKTKSNFKKGLDFHQNYGLPRHNINMKIVIAIIVVIIILVILSTLKG